MPQTIMPKRSVTVNRVTIERSEDGLTIVEGWNAPIADLELAISLFTSPLVEIADDEEEEEDTAAGK